MDTTLIGAILGSSVISVLVTQLFLKWKSDKQISIENITQERKEWRTRVRQLLLELTEAFENRDRNLARKVEAELIVRLNPEDSNDLEIINMFPNLYQSWDEKLLRQLSDRLSYLLKHDWERAKAEVGGNFSIYALLSSSVVAAISAYSFFIIINKLFKTKDLLLSSIAFNFGLWLIINVFALCIIDFVFKKYVKEKNLAIIGIVQRLKYRERSVRMNKN